jgi:transcriptional regulator of acetoin/glycerol metabolism
LLALHPDAAVLDHSMLSADPPTEGVASGSLAGTDRPEIVPEVGGGGRTAGGRARDENPAPAALLAALRAERGNVKRAAAALGISRGRLYRLMEKTDSFDLAAIRERDGPDG